MPFGVNSDPNFRAQKQRIRVKVWSFRTAETVVVETHGFDTLAFLEKCKTIKNGGTTYVFEQKPATTIENLCSRLLTI